MKRRLFGRRRRPWSPGLRNRVLEELTRSVALVTDFGALRLLICSRLREMTGCEAALFCEYQRVRSAFVVTGAVGGDVGNFANVAVDLNGPLVTWLQVNEDVLLVPRAGKVPTFLTEVEREIVERHRIRAVVPLLSINRLAGLVLLVSAGGWDLPAEDIAFLATFGRQAALACEAVGRHLDELSRERALQRAQQLAIAGQLAATVAHEVRNPMAAIRSTVQHVLTSERAWSRREDLLANLTDEIDRIERTVGRMLQLSRPSAVERAEIDLVAIVEEALQVASPHAVNGTVDLVNSLSVRPLLVEGDQQELRQVFLNLVLNAVQATPPGAKVEARSRLVIRRGPDGREEALAQIQVADTGHGMTPDVLQRAFDAFFTTKASGTGLGLPICLEIVNRHGGRIALSSEPEHGTVATVEMPLRKVNDGEDPAG